MRRFGFFSVILAVSLLFTVTVSADFPDMPQDEKAKTAITNAVSNKILFGYEDGTVRPDANITRAEMASIITRALGATTKADISDFEDVDPNAWYYPELSKAFYMGALNGDGNRHMFPNNNITFQETFTILSQVFALLPPYTRTSPAPEPLPENSVYTPINSRLYDISAFNARSDTEGTADWAKIFVAGVIAKGGCEGISISPNGYITRAQFAIVVDNIIKNYIDEPGTYDKLPEGNTIIRCDGVILNEVTTDADIFIADCVGQSKIEINDVTADRLVVRGCATPLKDDKTPENESFGISISGDYNEIRIIQPYIVADVTYANYKRLYTAEKTSVHLGMISD